MKACGRSRKTICLALFVCFGIYISTKTGNVSYDFEMVNSTEVLNRAQYHGISGCDDQVVLVVAVPTAPSHFYEREVYRQVYGHLPKEWKMIFFMGDAEASDKAAIKVESEQYRDIVHMNLNDTYQNLTLKSLLILKWVNEKCPKATFFLKFDDDIYLNIDNAKTLFKCLKLKMDGRNRIHSHQNCSQWDDLVDYQNGEAYIAGGARYTLAQPVRDPSSKWYLSVDAFPGTFFPHYLSGMCYLLSTNIIPQILKESMATPMIHLEDVYITGILLQKLHLKVRHIEGFNRYRPFLDDLCAYQENLVLHGVYPHELADLQQKVLELPPDSCTGFIEWRTKLVKFISNYFPKVKI